MMILVGVSVTVALNGGLFGTSNETVIREEIAIIQEFLDTADAKIAAEKASDGQGFRTENEKILEFYEITNPETVILEEQDLKYIANVEEKPERTCYILAPDKLDNLGIKSGRGKGVVEADGKVKDVFIVNGDNKRVYYIKSGTVQEEIEPVETVPEALLDYILGEKDETTGKRPGKNASDIMEEGEFKDIPDELQDGNLTTVSYAIVSEETIEKSDTAGNITYESGINVDLYFTYEDTMYKFRALANEEGTEAQTLAVKDLSYDKTSRVGKHVNYDGIDWIILYDDSENGLQMISADVIKNGYGVEYYKLGYKDETFTEDQIIEIDGNTEDKSELEIAMHSYSKAITTLNTICENSVTPNEGVIEGIRCVGSNPTIPNKDNEKVFIGSATTIPGYGTSTWFEDNLNLELNKTEQKTYYTISGTSPAQEYIIKDTDLNYEKDFDRMVALGINLTDTDEEYWLASRLVLSSNSESGRMISFGTRQGGGDGVFEQYWYIHPESASCGDISNLAIRPVIILETTALDDLPGDGLTPETAYQMETPEVEEPDDPSETDATAILTEGATINGEAPSSTNPFIPAGFKAVNTVTSSWNATNTPDTTNGLVIADSNKNQFVWIPVSDINEMAMCKTCGSSANSLNTQTGQCTNCGENTILVGKLYKNSAIVEYSDTDSREPAALTSAGETIEQQTQYENNYKAMVESVTKYGGFYIGRYETSVSSTGTAQSKKSTENNVIVSANASTNGSWTGLYSLQRTYSTESVQSEMIWGSQYDAMVRWLGTTAANSEYNTTRNPGRVPGDLIKNIYDIYGNSYEWTQESYGTNLKPTRGGSLSHGGSLTIDYRCTFNATYSGITSVFEKNGSRMTLYIIEESE